MQTLMYCLIGFLVLMIIPSVSMKVVSVNPFSEKCPQDIKDAFFAKHPGVKWLYDMTESFLRIEKHFNQSVDDFKSKVEKSGFDMNAIAFVTYISVGKNLLHNVSKILKRTSFRKADKLVRKYGVKGATEKIFGSYIEDLYFTTFAVDGLKDNDFTVLNNEDINKVLSECKNKAHNIRSSICGAA